MILILTAPLLAEDRDTPLFYDEEVYIYQTPSFGGSQSLRKKERAAQCI